MKKVILRNDQSMGESVALTAVLRDLHAAYPGEFLTDVRVPRQYPPIFDNDPHVARIDDGEDARRVDVHIDCDVCQTTFSRFVGDHVARVASALNLPRIKPTRIGGQIHLAPWGRAWRSQVADFVGAEVPYWIVVAGGKRDFTTKWWGARRYQEVVDACAGRVLFAQVGELGDEHPPLRGVVELRGRTDARGLARLLHRADGLVCGVTGAMHLSAATPTAGGGGGRPCAAIGGGREPRHSWSYPFHQNLSTVGTLPCNDLAGCWKDRTLPLRDGADGGPGSFCVDVAGDSPRCMENIRPSAVVDAVERYYAGGRPRRLSADERERVAPHLSS